MSEVCWQGKGQGEETKPEVSGSQRYTGPVTEIPLLDEGLGQEGGSDLGRN